MRHSCTVFIIDVLEFNYIAIMIIHEEILDNYLNLVRGHNQQEITGNKSGLPSIEQ